MFTDHRGNQEIEEFEPFKIVYVCNLLIPKPITQEKFESNITQMKEQSMVIDCSIDPEELEPEISSILKENNFFLVKPIDSVTNQNIKEISAYAEGKYDHQDVALSITMKKMVDHTNKLIIKALSEKEEKIIDLLRDISRKCDGLKIEPEFSTEITCDNCQAIISVTEYMKIRNSLICEKCGSEIYL